MPAAVLPAAVLPVALLPAVLPAALPAATLDALLAAAVAVALPAAAVPAAVLGVGLAATAAALPVALPPAGLLLLFICAKRREVSRSRAAPLREGNASAPAKHTCRHAAQHSTAAQRVKTQSFRMRDVSRSGAVTLRQGSACKHHANSTAQHNSAEVNTQEAIVQKKGDASVPASMQATGIRRVGMQHSTAAQMMNRGIHIRRLRSTATQASSRPVLLLLLHIDMLQQLNASKCRVPSLSNSSSSSRG